MRASFLIFLFLIPTSSIHAWTSIDIGTTKNLNGVWTGGGGVVFAVGDEGTVISSGSNWKPMATGTTDELFAVWGSSASDVYAVGGYYDSSVYQETGRILHYDGTSWSTVYTNLSGRYRAVWGSSATNVFAVGSTGNLNCFNGTKWRDCRYDPGWDPAWNYWNFKDVWGSSSSRVMVCGGDQVLLFDGTTWSAMPPADPGYAWHIMSMWGNLGVGLLGSPYTLSGNQWSQQTPNIPVYADDLWERYAVGNMKIYYVSGSVWSEMTNVDGSVHSVYGSGGSIYLAGATSTGGALWQGGGWTPPNPAAAPDVLRLNPALLGGPSGNSNTVFVDADEVAPNIGLPKYTVNTATLNLVLQGTLFRAQSAGPTEHVTLTYSVADEATPGMFGLGWSMNYESKISLAADGITATLRKGSGQILTFVSPVNLSEVGVVYPVTLQSPIGCHDTLICDATDWYFTIKKSKNVFSYPRGGANGDRLASITDRNGNAIVIDVNQTTGVISTVTDPAGRVSSFTVVGGRCTGISLPTATSSTLSFTYDASQRLASITDVAGYVGRYTYDDANGYMARADTDSRYAVFTYLDGGKSIAKVYDNKTYETCYTYDADSGKVLRTRRGGAIDYFLADENGQTTQITDPLSAIRSIGYSNNLPATFTDALGKITKYEYDASGNVTKATDALGRNYTFTYDANNNLLTRTNPLGATWTYKYDANSNPTETLPPTGAGTLIAYNANGTIKSIRDPNSNVTSFTYDSYGNLIKIADPLNNETRFEFDSKGLLCLKIIDQRGKEKHLEYDRNQRLTKRVQLSHPNQPGNSMLFDAFAQYEGVNELAGRTVATRDSFGYITQVAPPLGSAYAENFIYDPDHHILQKTNPLGETNIYTYDATGRRSTSQDPMGAMVRQYYDDDGNLVRITDERGNDTTLIYDDNNLLLSETYPDLGTLASTRDQLGRIQQTTNLRSQAITYTYDSRGRRTAKAVSGGGGTFTYTYDDVGNMLSHTDGTNNTAYVFDSLNRVTTITYPDGLAAGFTYDAAGNIASITYPGGMVATYQYDDFNRIPVPAYFRNGANTEIDSGVEPSPKATQIAWDGRSFLCTYDRAAKLTLETRPNGTTTSYTYDANQRVTGIIHGSPASNLPSLAYTLDRTGRTIGVSATNSVTPAIPSDLVAAYNRANQTTTFGGVAYTHDADGNLTATSDGRLAATYDPQNRVTSIARLGYTVTCTYDANGERMSRTDKVGTHTYHYDHLGRLLFETDAAKQVTDCYLYLGKKPIAMGTPANGFRYFHYDRTGNTLSLTGDDGNLVVAYAHLPYGGTSASIDGIYNPFTFNGSWGVMDDGGGLYYMKNRWYDATTGHFLQRDPIGHQGGLNLYAFAAGNPVDFVDPEGTFIWHVWYAAKDFFIDAPKRREVDTAVINRLSKRIDDPRVENRLRMWMQADKDDTVNHCQSGGTFIKEVGSSAYKAGLPGSAKVGLFLSGFVRGKSNGLPDESDAGSPPGGDDYEPDTTDSNDEGE